jgi:inner membrane transporter RhtA
VSAVVLGVARRPSGRGGSSRAIGWAVVLGLVIAAMNWLFYLAIARIPLGVVVTIEFWGPLAVAVAGSRRAIDLAWVALAGLGIWVLGGGRLVADDAIGVALALAAGGGWALFILIGGRVAREWPGGRGLAISTGVAAAVIVPVAVAGGAVGELIADPGFLLAGAAVALFASVIPWTLELTAMRRVASATYGILMSLEPAVAAAFGTVLLGQGLSAADAAAIGMVVAASAGASRTSPRPSPVPGELEA